MLLEAVLAPLSLLLIKVSVYTFLNITVSMRIFFSLCIELPLGFKEELFGCVQATGRYPPNIR